MFPGGVALLFRGISKTLCVSVREELVVAANDLPVKEVNDNVLGNLRNTKYSLLRREHL